MQELLDELNTSELLLLAQETNPSAHRGLDRETLYRIALGDEIELPERKVDRVRLTVMQFVDAHWKQVEPLVQGCPAKTRSLRACFQCTDVQAIECAISNPIVFKDRSGT